MSGHEQPKARETKQERDARIIANLKVAEQRKLAELADHPNPAITFWRMLPGHNHGAVLDGDKVTGYQVGVFGSSRFMPLTVARRLIKSGQIMWALSNLGGGSDKEPGLWITSNPDWQPKGKRS